MRHRFGVKEERRMKDKGRRWDWYYHQWLARLSVPHVTHGRNLFSLHIAEQLFSLACHHFMFNKHIPITQLHAMHKMYNKQMPQYELLTLPFDCSSGVNSGSLNIDLWPSAKAGSASGHFH